MLLGYMVGRERDIFLHCSKRGIHTYMDLEGRGGGKGRASVSERV